MTLRSVYLANRRQVHDELVFAVQAQELVQLFLTIRGDGAGAAADRFAGQIEILAHVTCIQDDILEQGGALRAQLWLQKSRWRARGYAP